MGDLRVWPVGAAGASGAAAGAGAAAPGAATIAMGAWVAITMGAPGPMRLMRTFSSPSVISSSPMPDSCTRSISFLSFLRSIGVLRGVALALRGGQACQGGFQRQLVALRPQPRYHADRQVGEIRVLAEGLAGMDV